MAENDADITTLLDTAISWSGDDASTHQKVNNNTKALNTFGATLQAVLDDLYSIKSDGESSDPSLAVRLEVAYVFYFAFPIRS